MPRSFADKLNQLFETIRRSDGSPYSLSEVAASVNKEGRTKLSASYLSELRTGRKDNPNVWVADALARFFGQPLEYFVDDDLAPAVPNRRTRTAGSQPVTSADFSTTSGRLAVLLAATQPESGRVPDSKQLAAWLAAEGHRVSISQLDDVRSGEKEPTAELVEAIAAHFDVPSSFLTDPAVATSLAGDIRLLRAMRDQGLRRLAFRANQLNAGDRERVADLINRLAGDKGMSTEELDF